MSLADAMKDAATRGRKPKHRTDDELTPAEQLARLHAENAGQSWTPPETHESIEKRATALRAAGFEHEADELAAQLGDRAADDGDWSGLTPQQIADRLYQQQ
jgi:hypothetical protein